jgi:hypothetical protein
VAESSVNQSRNGAMSIVALVKDASHAQKRVSVCNHAALRGYYPTLEQ